MANKVYADLFERGYKVERLDGDTIRSIFPQIGFDKDSRNQHIRRIGFLASMLEKNGVIVVASFISPYEESRKFVREQCNKFIEVYVSTSLEECERRDVKGLYKKVRAGEIKSFTGIDDPYEEPKNAEINIDTSGVSEVESFKQIQMQIKKYLA